MKIGEYEVQSELGRGGMGVVFRARSAAGKDVAVKVMVRVDRKTALARFDRERRLLSAFTEADGFVPLLDVGESPQGPFLVMPFLLRRHVARRDPPLRRRCRSEVDSCPLVDPRRL